MPGDMGSARGGTVTASDNPTDNVTVLKGMPGNPGRDPKAKDKTGKGSIGDVALKDAIILVVAAWLVILFLAYTLRNHNV